MPPLQWQQVQAPGFSDVSNILRNAAASWTEGFATLDSGFKDAHASQSRNASNSVIAEMAGIQNEADIEPFLASLGDKINPANMTPDFAAAVAGLRGGVLANDNTRAGTGLLGANTARVYGQEGRDQVSHDRGIANENAQAQLTNMFAAAGISGFNQDGHAVGSDNRVIVGNNGNPVTREQAMQSLPAGGLPSDPQAQTRNNNSTPMSNDGVFNSFMGTVRSSGLNNPYALAAVAATVQHESGFSAENGDRTWNDPSKTGRPGRAGGYMSWNNDRLSAMQQFTGGDSSPEAQAAYFMQEDPELIRALNNAGSVEEATKLMNDAWRFAGYDREGGEAGTRLDTAMSMVGLFQDGATGPTGDNGYRGRLDLPTDFDYSMGGVVRPDQIQELINGSIDQVVAGSDESRTARTDQQDYQDSLRQFNEDQITFNQGQEDRADSEQSALENEADRMAAEAAVNDIMKNGNTTSVAEANRLLARSDLTVEQRALAGPMLATMATEEYYSTAFDPNAPVGGPENHVVETYMKLNDNALYADAATRVNRRASEMAADTDPVLLMREAMPGLQMEDGEITNAIRDTIAEASKGPDGVRLSPAQAVSILADNEYTRSLVGGIFKYGQWGDIRIDPVAAGEMARDYFSQDNQAMAVEAIAESESRNTRIQEIQSRIGELDQRMAIQTDLYGKPSDEFEEARKELVDQLTGFQRDNPIPSTSTAPPDTGAFDSRGREVPENSAVQGTSVLSSDSFERTAQKYSMYLAEIRIAEMNPELAEIIDNPDSSPEERNQALRDAALTIAQNPSYTPHEREITLDGISLLAQTGMSSAEVRGQ